MKMGSNMSTESTETEGRMNIVVCSNSGEESVQDFIEYIKRNMPGGEESASVKFELLHYNMAGLKKFELRGVDALFLCHSMDIRGPYRYSDGSDSIYDKFLYKAKMCLGKKRVAVIVHDYKDLSPEALETWNQTNKSTFNKVTSLVLTLGQFATGGGPIQLNDVQQAEFNFFFEGVLSCRRRVGACYMFLYRLIRQ